MTRTSGRFSFRLCILSVAVAAALAPSGRVGAQEAGKGTKDDTPANATKPATTPKVAVFHIAGDVTETPVEDPLPLRGMVSVSLKDLAGRIRKASADPEVKAVVVFHDGGAVGFAQVEELRQALGAVRTVGKEVFAHSDSLSMRDYLLLSGASRLSVVPTADLWVTGLYSEAPYLRGLLDKIGVTPDFLAQGAYKSAAEMFLRDGPSPEAEAMQNWLLDSLYESYVALVGKGRGAKPDEVRRWIDEGPFTAERARALGLVDAVEARQDLEALLRSRFGPDLVFDKTYGQKLPPKIDITSPFGFLKLWSELLGETQKKKGARDAVGIVYVDGSISLGNGRPSLFGESGAFSSKIRKALDEAARDASVKGVVLRVNSPGGSAVASEIILDATRRVKAKKPFVVSMGDVAGSGGYYVACASDTIFADETTITASIGVVGGKIATSALWRKVGITFKAYQRGAHAGMLSAASPFTGDERKRMEAWMSEIYGVFKNHVRENRAGRLKKPIDELAGGRVFTGKQALELGLIDRIGTLHDAVAFVAEKAKVTDYEVRAIPTAKSFLEQLVEETSGAQNQGPGLDVVGPKGQAAPTLSLVELALPFLRGLEPERVRLVESGLRRLELMQREGVLMMMPEIALPR